MVVEESVRKILSLNFKFTDGWMLGWLVSLKCIWFRARFFVHAQTHMHINTHTHALTHTRTHTHTLLHTYTHAHTYTHSNTKTHSDTQKTLKHTHKNTYTQRHKHKDRDTYPHTKAQQSTDIDTQTHTKKPKIHLLLFFWTLPFCYFPCFSFYFVNVRIFILYYFNNIVSYLDKLPFNSFLRCQINMLYI